MAGSTHIGIERRAIPSLDGWRAVSIALVVGLHSLQYVEFHLRSGLATRAVYVLFNGALGVRIFFVLSGYLITRLLLRERSQTGGISLGTFYLRRVFRILPALYVYLGFLAVLADSHRLALPDRILVLCGVFLTSYVVPPAGVAFWPLEHLWSLCVEEQFYLLWPALLLWALGSAQPVRRKRACAIALAGIVLIPPVRVWWSLPPFGAWHAAGNIPLQLDVILFGVLGAVAEGHRRFERAYHLATRSPLLLAALLFGVSGWMEMSYPGRYIKSVGSTMNGALILALVLWTVRHTESACARMLNAPLMRWTGVLSYSLYLWQTFFLHRANVPVLGMAEPMPLPLCWLLLLCAAAASFFLVERPCLRLRDRVLRRGDSPRRRSYS